MPIAVARYADGIYFDEFVLTFKHHFVMISLKEILKTLQVLLISALICTQMVYAQDSTKKPSIKDLITSGNYIFEAQSAFPLSGQTRQLTYGFDMKISKDTINTYLPYFGRSYVAPVSSSDGAINFISTDFGYKAENRKKGGWEILIETNDQRDNKKMTLTIFESGFASLQVSCNDRQPISFNGRIVSKEK